MASRNINDLYNEYLYIIRKERGVFVTPSQFCQNMDIAQMELYEELFKVYGINQTIHDGLKPFKVTNYQFTCDSGGNVSYQSDYLHLLAGVFTVTGSSVNKIRFVEPDELPTALTNQLRAVKLTNPIAIDTSGGFQIYPQSVQTGFYSYMRRPAIPVLGFIQIGRTLTYDPNSSTQIEFSDAYINNIVNRALKPLGINLDENTVTQYGFTQEKDTE